MNRIKDLRGENKMTQADLAAAMNCTKVAISRYETGQREIDSDTISRLCDIFGVTADYLLCRSDNPEPTVSPEDLALLQAYHSASERDRCLVDQILQPVPVSKERPA